MYQFTLQARRYDDALSLGAPSDGGMQKITVLTDVNSDQQQGGLLADINIDRPTVARLGLTLNAIDNTLYDAFGQRQVSTIYAALNQYHVVMEVEPRYWQDPANLRDIWVSHPAPIPRARRARTRPPALIPPRRRPRPRHRRSQPIRRAISRSIRSPRPGIPGPPPALRSRPARRR